MFMADTFYNVPLARVRIGPNENGGQDKSDVKQIIFYFEIDNAAARS
jgi:hypothetical protein